MPRRDKTESIGSELSFGQWCLPALYTRNPAFELSDRDFIPEDKPFEILLNDAFEDIQVPERFIGRRMELRKIGHDLAAGKIRRLLITGVGGQGTLLAWGVRSDYVERDSEEPLAVVCGVCHSMHSNTFEGQLRFPVQTPDVELHLCARCHDRRSVADPNSSHGLEPHSPETKFLVGESGWIPPGSGLSLGSISMTHGSASNEKLSTDAAGSAM